MAGDFTPERHLFVLNNTDINWSNDDVTISCWVKFDNVTQGNRGVFGKWQSNAGWLMFNSPPAKIAFQTNVSGGRVTSTTTFVADTWYHLAAVHDDTAGTNELFVNGVSEVSTSSSTTLTGSGTTLRVGSYSFGTGGLGFDGKIAECGLWRGVLTDDEIASLASGVSPGRFRPDLLRLYAPCYRNAATEVDLSGFGHNMSEANGTVPQADHAPVGRYAPRPQYQLLQPGEAPPEPEVDTGGGAGVGTSKQVGVSLVDKQIRDTVPPPPKQRRKLETALHITAPKLVVSLEQSLRVRSLLSHAVTSDPLAIKANSVANPYTSLNITGAPEVYVSSRLEVLGGLHIPQKARVGIRGRSFHPINELPSETAITLLKEKAMRRFYNE